MRPGPHNERNAALSRQLLAAGLLLACSCGGESAPPLSAVLITVDTTNPAALDFYGSDRGLTPRLAELTAESVIFDRAHTVTAITLPAHTSMMTGLYPLRHGVRDNGLMVLPQEAETLAEQLGERGYQTAAFISAVVLSAPYGLDQGFDVYDEPVSTTTQVTGKYVERDAAAVTAKTLEWLAARDRSRPFFLWVHYFDPHIPYTAPSPFLELADFNPYRAEVAAMDAEIGHLLDGLRTDVGLEHMMLAVVADHGESHNRHGESTHGAFAYEATTRIPFLLRFPDARRGGERSDEMISVVDLFPTFLEELDIAGGQEIDGISLAGARVPEDRGVYLETYTGYLNYGWSPLTGWVDGRGKYLHSSRPEFYDLVTDPTEKVDLVDSEDIDVTPYIEALRALSEKPRLPVPAGIQLSEEGIRQLRALGYAAVGDLEGRLPDPLDPSDRPAPVERIEQYAVFGQGLALAEAHRYEEAIPLLKQVIAENPMNFFALEILGGCLIDVARYEEAIEVYEMILERGQDRFKVRMCLGSTNGRLGRLDEAEKHLLRAAELQPNGSKLAESLALVRKQKKMRDERRSEE